MDWRTIYKDKIMTADEAVRHIKSGDHVTVAEVGSQPYALTEALERNYEHLENVELHYLLSLGNPPAAKPGMEKHVRFHGMFLSGSTRPLIKENRGEFMPCFFHQYPKMVLSRGGVDVMMISISEPDKHGFCSIGPGVDHIPTMKNHAKLIIAQMNKNLPRVMGNSFVHLRDVDIIVEEDRPIPTLPGAEITDVERKIGEYCASLVNDGDTLQLGIGGIPDAVVTFLKDKKDLGLHTEMAADGIVDLIKAGIINNKKKTLHPGKCIATFAAGSQNLYDFLDDNPNFELHGVDYVNDPNVIAMNDNMVSINSCIQVDLVGQINAEVVKGMQFSGVGGQVDFIRGARMSKGGRSIIALPSTAAKGTISKIVPFLDHGAYVTTSRMDVDYIVTEYGIAHLWGKTLRERAKALIAIAHPDFRPTLAEEYAKRFGETLEI
ncbi:MAG: acetyl-CoA hydrolase/transferase family protein [Anaerotignum sp.]|nr:acetyl-CoA hydrolase/transferase family protein [Anaerotignum sp.]